MVGRAQLGLDNPDGDWLTLCTDCNALPGATWSYEWNFTVSDGGWAKRPGYNIAVYVAGEGWKPGSYDNEACQIHKELGSTFTWTRTEVYTNKTQGYFQIYAPTFDNYSCYLGQMIYPNVQVMDHTHTITCNATSIGTFSNASSRITKIVIHGQGTPPTTLTGGTLTVS